MQTIELSDGTVIENAHCILMDTTLFVYIEKIPITEGFAYFTDPSRLEKITCRYAGTIVDVHEGYTKLYSVSAEYGNCNVVLKKN